MRGRSVATAAAIAMATLANPARAQVIDPMPPGQLIDLGGFKMHLFCTGARAAGRPTVVLSAGGGDFATDWGRVQRPLSDSARVCSYDRPGYGWSDPGPASRTFHQEAFDLHEVLAKAGEAPPYLLVGHSLGGAVVRRFAERYPSEVAGMVLVGALNENGKLGYAGKFIQPRLVATERPIPPTHGFSEAPIIRATGAAVDSCQLQSARSARISRPYDQLGAQAQRYRIWALSHPSCTQFGDDYFAEELASFYAAWSKQPHPLGDLPLIVIQPTQRPRPPGLSEEEWRSDSMQVDLSKLSTRGTLVLDSLSGHHVHLDDPSIVINAIRELLKGRR